MTPTTKLVTDLVAYVGLYNTDMLKLMSVTLFSMQACYVNTTHPDFISGHKACCFDSSCFLLADQYRFRQPHL